MFCILHVEKRWQSSLETVGFGSLDANVSKYS